MAANKRITSAMPDLKELKELLGPWPVLNTESADRAEEIFDRLISSLKPRNMIEAILIREFAEQSWDINRYTRHRTLSFERIFRQTQENQIRQLKNQEARRETLAGTLAGHLAQRPSDIAGLTHMEDKVNDSINDVNRILEQTPTELDHNRSLERSITLHKDSEFLIGSLARRRNDGLHMLHFVGEAFGGTDAQADDIVDAEYDVVEEKPQLASSPALVPTMDPAAEVTKQIEASSANPAESVEASGKNEGDNEIAAQDRGKSE